MTTTELFVSLKVPDNVAITAFHALERMGFYRLKNLERQDYYRFEFTGNVKSFQDKISKVDILVNANKHKYSFNLENSKLNQKYPKINILVQDLSDGKGLLSILKTRLGFKNIKKIEKGTLWSLSIDADEKEATNISVQITKNLLMNENYQKFKIL